MSQPFFTPALFSFLRQLAKNNDRDWFKANQRRYEADVREPALAFIRAMDEHLCRLSKHIAADDRKVGGSLMRPQRDTRFSPDKTPYKTNVGIHFRHEAGKDVHAPGFYVHLDASEVFVGVGMWRPEAEALAKVRQRIVDKPQAWRKVRDADGFAASFQLAGDSLKRPPKGFDAEHPLIEDLKRKDHVAMCQLDVKQAVAPGFDVLLAERFAAARPYAKFLCEAVGLPF